MAFNKIVDSQAEINQFKHGKNVWGDYTIKDNEFESKLLGKIGSKAEGEVYKVGQGIIKSILSHGNVRVGFR